MAGSKSTKKRANVHFIGFEPTKEQKDAINNWGVDSGVLEKALWNAVESGNRVSLAKDTYNRCYQCSISEVNPEEGSVPVILQGRGSDPEKALRRGLFAFYEVWGGEVPKVDQLLERDDDF